MEKLAKYIFFSAVVGVFFSCNNNNQGKEQSNAQQNQESTNDDENASSSSDMLSEINNKRYTIIGKIDNSSAVQGPVYLNQLIQQNLIRKDTATVDGEGNFVFEGRVEVPDFYQIVFSNGKYYVLILDNQELEFYADMNDFDETKKLSGSRNQEVFEQITGSVNKRNQKRNELTAQMQQAQEAQDTKLMEQITDEYMAAEEESIEELKNVLRNSTDSYVAAIGALNFLDANKDFQFMDSLSGILSDKFENSRYVIELKDKVNALRQVSVGADAPPLVITNPDGERVSLDMFEGKYVLLDFWASWCRPCRAENPNVVKMYKEFRDKNFEILGVSLDNDQQRWKDAIQKDGLIWKHASQLKGWQSPIAETYQVRSIPATFLIDPNGKIIAKNLRGEELRQKLIEILG